MNDELDPELMRHFAAAHAPLDGATFSAGIERGLQKARGARRMRRWVLAIALLAAAVAVGPYVITASVALNEQLVALMLSPWGYGVSILAGAVIVRRAHRLALR